MPILAKILQTIGALILGFLTLAGIGSYISLPFSTHQNEPAPASTSPYYVGYHTFRLENDFCGTVMHSPRPARDLDGDVANTQASFLRYSDLKDGLFVGIALSGGGSRAANFSAAVLFELQELGVLPSYVTALSSVSGGSLTAAYYGLFHEDQTRWKVKTVKYKLRQNFELHGAIRAFLYPQNYIRYFSTGFSRSDIMAGVFEDYLFAENTFKNLREGPKIYLNATIRSKPCSSFVFTDEIFNSLGSRLDNYPVAYAAMASAAFPGVFSDIGIKDYTWERLQKPEPPNTLLELFDGGPTDNFGIRTLLQQLKRLQTTDNDPVRGCFLFVVDAYPNFTPDQAGAHLGDNRSRSLVDYFIDTNALEASDILMTKDRSMLIKDYLGIINPFAMPTQENFSAFQDSRQSDTPIRCSSWLIHFNRLKYLGMQKAGPLVYKNFTPTRDLTQEETLADHVNQIKTRLTLTSDRGGTPEELQTDLFEAAHRLIRNDTTSLSFTCQWFAAQGVFLNHCPETNRADTGSRSNDSEGSDFLKSSKK